jgi:hypothetical protein
VQSQSVMFRERFILLLHVSSRASDVVTIN